MMRVASKDKFTKRLEQKFQGRISLVQEFDVVKAEEKVNLFCHVCGLPFSSSYATLFSSDTKKGCTYCKHNKKHMVYGLTNDIFLKTAIEKWGTRFTYIDLDVQKNIRAEEQQIKVHCTLCNLDFTTNIRYHLFLNPNGGGCVSCAKRLNSVNVRRSTEEFIKLAKQKWGDLYSYEAVKYINVDTKVKIFCNTHQDYFLLTPYTHLNNKYGCPICGNKKKNARVNAEVSAKFAAECKRREVEDNLDMSRAVYTRFYSSIEIGCKTCGCWYTTIGQNFLRGRGNCPHCYRPRCFSKVSQDAVKKVEEMSGLTFLRGVTGGEFSIQREKNKYKAVGYNKDLNIVLEFYGDAFHGNPNKYSPDKRCHPYYKQFTAQDLYQQTMGRESFIRSQGYNLIAIWEQDWHSAREATLTKIIKEIKEVKVKYEACT